MMQISSNKIEDFSLIGKWINEITTDAKPSIELSFYNNQKVIIRLNPGNEFQLDYFIESKFDYNILRFADEVTGEIEFSVFLYKVIDEKTLKVQLIDKDDIPEWDNKAPEINIGFLYRKETN